MLPLSISKVASEAAFKVGSMAGGTAFEIKFICLVLPCLNSGQRQGRERKGYVNPRSAAGSHGKKAGLASGDRGDDADLVAVFNGCGFFLLEADVFVIDEDIHETANIALLVADAFDQAGMGGIKGVENVANIGSGRADDFLIVGEFAQGRWDSDLDGHGEEF